MVGWVVSLNGNKASLSLSCTWNLAELSIFFCSSNIFVDKRSENILHFNPQRRGGGQLAHQESKRLFFWNRMSDWPGCKFKFFRCIEVHVKKLINIDLEGTLVGQVLLKSASQGPFRGPSGDP